jgi:hypothetical protein
MLEVVVQEILLMVVMVEVVLGVVDMESIQQDHRG